MPETVDRSAVYANLPADLKKIDVALTELNKVMAGANTDPEAGGFKQDAIWGKTAVKSITAYMETLKTDTQLKAEIDKLLKGLPGTSEVAKAIKTAADGITSVVKSIEDKANELGNGAGPKFEALTRLITPHTDDPNYTYKPYEDPFKNYQYGLFPAVAELINTSGSNIKVEEVLGPLKELEALINAGLAITDFVAYANGTVNFLGRTLTPTA